VLLATFAVGALPWIWANVGSHLASLSPGQVPVQPGAVGYLGRVSVFFHHVLPLDLGLTRLDDGKSLLGTAQPIVQIGLVAIIVGALVLCALRGGPSVALAIGVVAFPFLYALSPNAWAWADGRYANYLLPLLAIVLGVGATEAVARAGITRGAGSWLMAGGLIVASLLSIGGLRSAVESDPANYTSTWGNPDAATLHLIHQMQADGVHTAYADYWVAYKLDFLSQGHLAVTTAGYESNRSRSIDRRVTSSDDPAWIFVPPREAMLGGDQFTSPSLTVGVDTVTQPEFEIALRHLDVPYNVFDLGLAHVVVPVRRVTPFEAGLPGSAPP
jgi:hypothetical protein